MPSNTSFTFDPKCSAQHPCDVACSYLITEVLAEMECIRNASSIKSMLLLRARLCYWTYLPATGGSKDVGRGLAYRATSPVNDGKQDFSLCQKNNVLVNIYRREVEGVNPSVKMLLLSQSPTVLFVCFCLFAMRS